MIQSDSVLAERKARELIEASNQAEVALDHDITYAEVMGSQLPFLDEVGAAREDRDTRLLLLKAGLSLLEALETVANDDEMWRRLSNSEVRLRSQLFLAFEQEMRLREIMTHNVPQLLLHFGYRMPPPPPAEQWSAWLQGSFSALLASGLDDATAERRANQAEYELICFLRRFRRLLRDAADLMGAEQASQATRQELVMRRFLSTAVRAARDRAIPAALGAGAAAAVAGPLGLAAGATTGVAAAIGGAVATEWVKVSMEGVAVAGLSALKADSDLPGTPSERLGDPFSILALKVHELTTGRYDRSDLESGRIHFIIRRGVFDLLQSLSDNTGLRSQAWSAADRLLKALDIGDWTAVQQHTQELGLHLGETEILGMLAVQQALVEAERRQARDREEELVRVREEESRRQEERRHAEQLERERKAAFEEERRRLLEEAQRRQSEEKSQQRYMER